MANLYNAKYKRFNGTDWDTLYFETSAAQVVTNADRTFLTEVQKTSITTYLSTFNVANKLAKLDAAGKLTLAMIPDLSSLYLSTAGGEMTGPLTVPGLTVTPQYVDRVVNIHLGEPGVSGESRIQSSSEGVLIHVDNGYDYIKNYRFDPTNGLDIDGGYLSSVRTATLAHHAVNKGQMDEAISNAVSLGVNVVEAVKAASIANVNITAALSALDGYTLAANDRILLKNQTTASENGIYQLNASKIPQKIAADSVEGATTFVENGTVNNDRTYHHKKGSGWVLFTKPDIIQAGAGLTRTGDTLSIPTGGVSNSMISSITQDKVASISATDAATVSAASAAKSLLNHFSNLYTMIKNIKGTTNAHTAQADTILSVKDLAASKNRTYLGTANPSTSGYTTGDLYFQYVA